MKRMVLAFVVLLLYSCESNKDFLIINNSDDDIIVVHNDESFVKNKPLFMHSDTWGSKGEYNTEFLVATRIPAHSSDNRFAPKVFLLYEDIDTLFIAVFNLLDCDTLSFEDFKKKYPIKHEFKVTLQDMIDREWTLVYPPEE
jgi:hypothetical protein